MLLLPLQQRLELHHNRRRCHIHLLLCLVAASAQRSKFVLNLREFSVSLIHQYVDLSLLLPLSNELFLHELLRRCHDFVQFGLMVRKHHVWLLVDLYVGWAHISWHVRVKIVGLLLQLRRYVLLFDLVTQATGDGAFKLIQWVMRMRLV